MFKVRDAYGFLYDWYYGDISNGRSVPTLWDITGMLLMCFKPDDMVSSFSVDDQFSVIKFSICDKDNNTSYYYYDLIKKGFTIEYDDYCA